MYGKAKKRADKVLKHAEENFNLKTLITEANLKRVGALSDRVGTICKFRRFKAGKPVPTPSDEEESEDDGELIKIDEKRRIDLDKGN